MQIHVGSGIGTGPTTMAAFDYALNEAGIANFNMLRLSSIVPPKTDIIVHDGKIPYKMPGTWGDRMYVVMAEKRIDKHNADAWAGVGWVQDRKTGRGMFTEHEGGSKAFVRREIEQSLNAFGTTCHDKPVCALVAVVFQTSDWDNKAHFFSTSRLTDALRSKFWSGTKFFS